MSPHIGKSLIVFLLASSTSFATAQFELPDMVFIEPGASAVVPVMAVGNSVGGMELFVEVSVPFGIANIDLSTTIWPPPLLPPDVWISPDGRQAHVSVAVAQPILLPGYGKVADVLIHASAATEVGTQGVLMLEWPESGARSTLLPDDSSGYVLPSTIINVVPEPATIGLLGLLSVAVSCRRKLN